MPEFNQVLSCPPLPAMLNCVRTTFDNILKTFAEAPPQDLLLTPGSPTAILPVRYSVNKHQLLGEMMVVHLTLRLRFETEGPAIPNREDQEIMHARHLTMCNQAKYN